MEKMKRRMASSMDNDNERELELQEELFAERRSDRKDAEEGMGRSVQRLFIVLLAAMLLAIPTIFFLGRNLGEKDAQEKATSAQAERLAVLVTRACNSTEAKDSTQRKELEDAGACGEAKKVQQDTAPPKTEDDGGVTRTEVVELAETIVRQELANRDLTLTADQIHVIA